MDTDLALEALSALTEVLVKPLPDGGVPNSQCSGGRGGAALRELTTENLISSVFDEILQSQVLTPRGLFLSHPSSQNYATSCLTTISALRKEQFVNVKNFFDPKYDCDFRSSTDSSKCSRGGEPYSRPQGWYRFALKVLDKYEENDWLGSDGWRSESSPGEWPVSFHGTSIEAAKAIAGNYFRPGSGEVYGRGIYSTPDISEAECYTKMFKSSKNGKTYKVIMQNRINPEKREFTKRKDYWLIPIPEGTSPEKAKNIVRESIRPYGILIKEHKADDCSIL